MPQKPDKVVELPDGKVVSFPGVMADDAIAAAIKSQQPDDSSIDPRMAALATQSKQQFLSKHPMLETREAEARQFGPGLARSAAQAGFGGQNIATNVIPRAISNIQNIPSMVKQFLPHSPTDLALTLSGAKGGEMVHQYGKQLGEQIGSGDVGGGIANLGTDIAMGEMTRLGGKLVGKIPAGELMNKAAEGYARPVVRRPLGATMEDLNFGKNPARALVGEGISGATKQGVLDKVTTKTEQIGQAIDQRLSQPQHASKVIDVEPIINAEIQKAMASAAKLGEPALLTRIQNLKEALLTQFGNLKKNPLDAAKMKREIGDSAKWSGQPFDNEVNQLRVNIYRGINDQINAAVPEVKPLNSRFADLMSAKSALKRNVALNTGKPMTPGNVIASTLTAGTIDALNSTAARTTLARMLGKRHPGVAP